MERNPQFFTVMHNRVCEQTNLTGFFDPAGYGMPGCPMFHRSARIDRPTDQPVKHNSVENSANNSTTRTALTLSKLSDGSIKLNSTSLICLDLVGANLFDT